MRHVTLLLCSGAHYVSAMFQLRDKDIEGLNFSNDYDDFCAILFIILLIFAQFEDISKHLSANIAFILLTIKQFHGIHSVLLRFFQAVKKMLTTQR